MCSFKSEIQMTIKQKNRILLGGFTVLVLIAYQFSFKKTLAPALQLIN